MLNTPIFDIIHSASISKTYQPKQQQHFTATTGINSKFDSVAISSQADAQNHFQKEMVSRLSQDIRTTTTTGKIQDLRQAVACGEYHPDPAKIAKCLLFQLEE